MVESADFDDLFASPATAADWRDDPAWKLSAYDPEVFPEQPPDRPAAAAELAQPPLWASLYAGSSKLVATWYRLRANAPSG